MPPKPKYGIRGGFHFRSADATALAKATVALDKRLKRPPTPEDVVTEAESNHQSPFYAVFDAEGLWDDAVAARAGRIHFARIILRAIDVTVVRGHESYQQRAFIPVRFIDPAPATGYTALENVMHDPDRRRAYLQRLHEEAQRLNERIQAWLWLIQTDIDAAAFAAAVEKYASAPSPVQPKGSTAQ